ncbi:MAG: tetratricopeptide repeat protein [Rhodovibrionaceae bacterium]
MVGQGMPDANLSDTIAQQRRILAHDPDDVTALMTLGLSLCKTGAAAEALPHLARAEQLAPRMPEAKRALAEGLLLTGRRGEAIARLLAALEIAPERPILLMRTSRLLVEAERYAEALPLLQRLVVMPGAPPDSLVFLAQCYERCQRHEEAVSTLERIAARHPDDPVAHFNLGKALTAAGRAEDAVTAYQQAAVLAPGMTEAHCNLSTPLRDLGRYDKAEAAARQALALRPDYPNAHQNLAQALFGQGRLSEAWAEHAWRWKNAKTSRKVGWRDFAQPYLERPPEAGERLLVWGEEAIGEEILFASMVPELAERGIACIFECAPRLAPLFARSMPGVTVVPRSDPPDAACLDPAIGGQTSSGDLGRWLRPGFDAFPDRRSYLQADPQRAAALRKTYRARGDGPVIGISWRSKHAGLTRHKSTQLADWLPILRARDANFVNLQYGDCTEEIANLNSEHGIAVYDDPEVDSFVSLDDFAAQVAAMDLVISVSNTTVHMAGALGVETWAMIPAGRGAYWFWFPEKESSPWYPSVRLYRQEDPFDWAPPIAAIGTKLENWRATEAESA